MLNDTKPWVHIWPYASLEERDHIRVESFKLDTWPPKTREFMAEKRDALLARIGGD